MPDVPYDRLRGLGAFFALTRGPLDGGTVAAGLLGDPAVLDVVIDRYAERLGTSRRDIAGSLFLQGWAGRVLSVHLGCRALTGAAPDLDPANLRFRYGATGVVELALAQPELHSDRTWTELYDGHLAALVAAVDERSGPGVRRLWGNVASAYAGAVVMLRRKGFAVAAPMPVALTDYGDWHGDRYQRRTCCNLFRVEGYGLCGDCVIPR